MHAFLTAAKYQILAFTRMRNLILTLFLQPLVLILLLGHAFGGEMKPAKVGLFIEDTGVMSSSIDDYWHSDKVKQYAVVEAAQSEEETRQSVESGRYDYGIVIPKGFSDDVAAGNSAHWVLMPGHDDSRNIAVRAVEDRYLSEMNLSQAAAINGIDNAANTEVGATSTDASAETVKVGTLGASAGHLFGTVNANQYYAVSNLIMFLLYAGMTGTIALQNEKQNFTLQRIYTQPSRFNMVVYGKLAGVVCFGIAQSVVIIAFTTFVYDVDWGNRLDLTALVCLLSIAAGIGLSIVMASFFKSNQAFRSFYSIFIFVATFLSGGMVANLDGTVGELGKFTLNYWSTKGLRGIMNGVDGTDLWMPIGVLAMIAVVLLAVGAARMSKVVKVNA
ncbi:ABC-2 type transport system permease protein [Paenibacillus cellulosilyticus]|uniref:ABC-2 type transport system permease protein n=1 Tax=Paenibacillus cellulosilyticus TaxID=375489 RepID=A0A2V2YWM1_9BACL|nr:ABC transporter permease [Paenibacillus cellulosilyticus]PWW06147.1 ABC-2 type transport system permease protein [Paenibacillus cellulosilyticus]QKS43084.1 ABC transporter permease [Paenibacillus cellulosilyticus]